MATDGTFTGLCELELVYVPLSPVLSSKARGRGTHCSGKGEPGPKAGPPAKAKLFLIRVQVTNSRSELDTKAYDYAETTYKTVFFSWQSA